MKTVNKIAFVLTSLGLAAGLLTFFSAQKMQAQDEPKQPSSLPLPRGKLAESVDSEPRIGAKSLPALSVDIATNTGENSFVVGHAVELKVTLKNERQQTLYFDDPLRDLDIVVKDSYGNIMPLTRFGSMMKNGERFSTVGLELKSQDSKQYMITLNRFIDMTMDGQYDVQITSYPSSGSGEELFYSKSQVLKLQIGGEEIKE